jgi:hypothetical protein
MKSDQDIERDAREELHWNPDLNAGVIAGQTTFACRASMSDPTPKSRAMLRPR